MRVLILRDDRPGHYLQSEGFVAALARRQPVEIERTALAGRPVLAGRVLRGMAASGLSPSLLLRMAHGLRMERLTRPDLIVSAGSETLVANLLLARVWDCANLFIGSLRGVPAECFSAVLTIYPRLADGDRVILAAKPTTVDPDMLPRPRPVNGANGIAGAAVSVMVGGPTPAHLWTDADWRSLAETVARLRTDHGAAVTVTTSPRTPASATATLVHVAAGTGTVVSAFGSPDALPRDHFFAADAIIVTGDSATMAFEAVSARRPVVVLDPSARRPARDDEAFSWLAAEGRIARLSLPTTATEIVSGLAAARPLEAHPMDLILAEIAPALARADINVTPMEP